MVNINEVKKNLADSYLVVRQAIGDNSKEISVGLRELGKKASPTWVYAQGYQRQLSPLANFHETNKRWLGAMILRNCIEGADLLLADTISWTENLKRMLNFKRVKTETRLLDLVIIRQHLDNLIFAQ